MATVECRVSMLKIVRNIFFDLLLHARREIGKINTGKINSRSSPGNQPLYRARNLLFEMPLPATAHAASAFHTYLYLLRKIHTKHISPTTSALP